MTKPEGLSRRERQVMEAVYALEEATAKQIQERLPDPPSYSAVRAVLARLVEAGHLKYRENGPRYVYSATQSRQRLRRAALSRVVDTFFDGSPLHLVNALLGETADRMTAEELEELERLVTEAKEKRRGS